MIGRRTSPLRLATVEATGSQLLARRVNVGDGLKNE
jgi:hypothetical protein